ncbi:uncharacterized protein LOC126843885 [Adelges cooleyi]|uniref:uncharacterized protein LOC126843885 n=1 Tax=Adelges cooleyi TaxID=133065 RepID=UPI00218000A8|nr:uncharacterized protein LOC126843885 [Adelges cooleyi]
MKRSKLSGGKYSKLAKEKLEKQRLALENVPKIKTLFSKEVITSESLPKLKLPSFSGVLTEWQGFEDLFKSILSHAPDLPDVERFEYLRTALEGEPLSLISHLPLTALNYSSAWDILRARYGNKRDLARVHFDALLSPHVVKSTDNVCTSDGKRHTLRALTDSGSQASFITEKCAVNILLPRSHSHVNITSFARSDSTRVKGKSTIIVAPCGQKTPLFSVDTYIVLQITGPTPQIPIVPGKWTHIQNLPLADPFYHRPQAVNLLLGADILPLLLLEGKTSGHAGEPIAIETVFGWILMGPVDACDRSTVKSLCLSVSESLDSTIKQFWELEELPSVRHLSPDDVAAETIYQNTTTRLDSGRFMVTIPFWKPVPLLGDSKTNALRQYKFLEVRLSKNNDLRKQYVEFMQDYLTAGHMELVPPAERDKVYSYYIPHHCVLRPDSSTAKLRVVFNASARTTIGLSLNESMYTGPKLQPDIQIVLLRSRLWQYLFMADIKQMYRQILVQPADRDYLRIFWRFYPNSTIEEYRLCTVTYGTSAAPYQALRTIRELANVDGKQYPLAAAVLLNDTFVDDILTGANSTEDALECQSQLIKLCALAKFELRKWISNNDQVLQAVADDDRAMSPFILFNTGEQHELKVLGLRWDPATDAFSFKRTSQSNISSTKTPLRTSNSTQKLLIVE